MQPFELAKSVSDHKLAVNDTELDVSVWVLKPNIMKKHEVKLTTKALLEKTDILEKERKAKLNKLYKLKQTNSDLMGDKEHANEVKCTFDSFLGPCD